MITAIEGTSVADADEVQRVVGDGNVGQTLTLEVQRNGDVQRIAVKPENLPK